MRIFMLGCGVLEFVVPIEGKLSVIRLIKVIFFKMYIF